MEQFIARQPIFDRNKKVFAYELLFRSGLDNYFSHVDGDQASSKVIANSLLLFGVEEMTGDAKAFINFTRSLLVKDYAISLPSQWVVVEVLENVEPDEEVVASCAKLKNNGFILALDDFVYDPVFEKLLDLADIVKVDFMVSDLEERKKLAETLLPRGIKLLAEKVETQQEFEEAMEMGYSYFQGYFFCKPVILSRNDIPVFKLNYMRILKLANEPDFDFDLLADTIGAEVSISYKLLKYVNSAAFGLRREVTTIKHALTMLGQKEIKKWVSLLTLSGMATDKPLELVVTSLIRAKFCELIAQSAGMADMSSDLFLMGLFSLLDAIVGRPLEEIIKEIPLHEDVIDALLGKENRLGHILSISIAFEKGAWQDLASMAKKAGVDEKKLPEDYVQAIQWPQQLLFN